MIRFFLVLILAVVTSAWGPYTHEGCGCELVGISTCTKSNPSFLAGASSPDVFKTVNSSYHSFNFATALWATAKLKKPVGNFDPLSFASAYGTHLAEDLVAHHSKSYLWAWDHELEVAVDTYMVKERESSGDFTYQGITDDEVQMVLETALLLGYNVNSSQLHDAADNFNKLTSEEAIVIILNIVYKAELYELGPCNEKVWEKQKIILDRALDWSVEAGRLYNATVYEENPESAVLKVQRFVEDTFAQHDLCTA